jgi:hypothetical protein
MGFNQDECRRLLLEGILGALEAKAADIQAIGRTVHGECPISGVSLDMAPWHCALGLSLRLNSEVGDDRYDIAGWQYFDFVSQQSFPGLQPVADFIGEAYCSEGEFYRREMAHLIFLAGAEALLDERAATYLIGLGLEAPILGSEFGQRYFEYMVFDPDCTIRANYCELVLANRVTARFRR